MQDRSLPPQPFSNKYERWRGHASGAQVTKYLGFHLCVPPMDSKRARSQTLVSSAGRASGCEPESRGFESRTNFGWKHPPVENRASGLRTRPMETNARSTGRRADNGRTGSTRRRLSEATQIRRPAARRYRIADRGNLRRISYSSENPCERCSSDAPRMMCSWTCRSSPEGLISTHIEKGEIKNQKGR